MKARQLVVNYIWEHQDMFQDFVVLHDGENFQSYLEKMSRQGNRVEVQTEMKIRHINIVIYECDSDHNQIIRPNTMTTNVHVHMAVYA